MDVGDRDVAQFVDWLREFNADRVADDCVGFFGLDVYSLWDSMREVVSYLEHVDPAAAARARHAYASFEPFHGDQTAYTRATAMVPASCEQEAVSILRAVRVRAPQHDDHGRDALFDAEQNALVAVNAEHYYRTMVRGGSASWNVRDRHMMETLERLVAHHGPTCKAIVWEQTTHIGDARFTDMERAGMVNVGQLAREAWGGLRTEGSCVALVGFGTHRGTVLEGDEWGATPEAMRVPEAQEGSWEACMHATTAGTDGLVLFDSSADCGIEGLGRSFPHRAIGVVYDPAYKRYGNWVPTVVPRRYDAFVFIDETNALEPLAIEAVADIREVP